MINRGSLTKMMKVSYSSPFMVLLQIYFQNQAGTMHAPMAWLRRTVRKPCAVVERDGRQSTQRVGTTTRPGLQAGAERHLQGS